MDETLLMSLETEAVSLLKNLIETPSFSREENQTAQLLETFFLNKNIPVDRIGNNIIVRNENFNAELPTILLNSHHDTVKPNNAYTKDPFSAIEEEGKLFGLGSNDAGGPLVSLISCFLNFYAKEELAYNLILAATAEEEISGQGGIEMILSELPPIEFAIVGEPTEMKMAIAERGLMVIDCRAIGKAGHAARDEGINALTIAVNDIHWISQYSFPKNSDLLGPVKLTATVIHTDNKAHNVIPDHCDFVIDARVNEYYDFEEVLSVMRANMKSEINPRSTRLRSSAIAMDHPVVLSGLELGMDYYGSPTTSDKALMPFPALKIGPGDSARSHTADEFIYLQEIKEGIALYIKLLEPVIIPGK